MWTIKSNQWTKNSVDDNISPSKIIDLAIFNKKWNIEQSWGMVLWSWKITNFIWWSPKWIWWNYLPRFWEYNRKNLWNWYLIISNDYIYIFEELKAKQYLNNSFKDKEVDSWLDIIKWLDDVKYAWRMISIKDVMGLKKHNWCISILELNNPANEYTFSSDELDSVLDILYENISPEQIEEKTNIFLSEYQTKAINNDFQEFLWRINNFQDKCYKKIDTMKKEFNLEHPIIESNTDSYKLFMVNWAITDSENTIKEWHKLLEEFNNFDLNDNGINQCFWFFKLTLECLEETYEKVKMKYGPAISTYKTLRKITSKNAVYKPSEINYDDTANTENNVKAQDNKKDDSDENSTLTTEIWVILIIIWIIILIALNS